MPCQASRAPNPLPCLYSRKRPVVKHDTSLGLLGGNPDALGVGLVRVPGRGPDRALGHALRGAVLDRAGLSLSIGDSTALAHARDVSDARYRLAYAGFVRALGERAVLRGAGPRRVRSSLRWVVLARHAARRGARLADAPAVGGSRG